MHTAFLCTPPFTVTRHLAGNTFNSNLVGRSAEKLPTENQSVVPFRGPSKTCPLWRILLALLMIPCLVNVGRPDSRASSSATSIFWCWWTIGSGCGPVSPALHVAVDVDVDVNDDFLVVLPDKTEDKSSDKSLLKLAEELVSFPTGQFQKIRTFEFFKLFS